MPRVLLLVCDYVEDYEAMVPLQTIGHSVDVVSPNKKAGSHVKTTIHDFLEGEQTYTELHGHDFAITKDWDSVKPEHYDALVIQEDVRPGLLKGRKVTTYPALKADLVNAGAVWVGECPIDCALQIQFSKKRNSGTRIPSMISPVPE